jgi:hypothetical protein
MEAMKRESMKRRTLLGALGAGAVVAAGGCLVERLVRVPRSKEPLSEAARALLARAWEGIDVRKLLDAHVHLVGMGAGGTGCYVNPKMHAGLRHPMLAAEFFAYERAGGIRDESHADAQYKDALLALMRGPEMRGRCLLLAFDETYDEEGRRHPEDTEFYTPNAYVLQVARESPECFLPAASVHPYRPDCMEELTRAAQGGAVCVKWLPNAQRIDPASPKCDAFYEKMASLGLPLLSHAGEEAAVQSEGAQQLGNPLKFRRALDHGVKVILAHCASLGTNPDLDSPGAPPKPNLELFFRLMGEQRYRGHLFGDVSALTQVNRCEPGLREVLGRAELHERLINGSDYPLPAINALIRTGKLVSMGMLQESDRSPLDELYAHNPLAFDFALKRCLTLRTERGELRFPPSVFMTRPELFG